MHSEQQQHDAIGNVNMCTFVSSRFEKMAESCKKSLEVLKLAQSRGLPPPRHQFEERLFHTVRWETFGNFDVKYDTICSVKVKTKLAKG